MWPFKKKHELIGNSIGSMYLYDLGRTGCVTTEPLRTLPEIKWEYKCDVGISSLSPVIFKNILLILSEDHYLHAIDIDNGELKWEYLSTTEISVGKSSPAVADDIVYFNNSLYLYAVDVEKGKLKWKFEASNGGHSSPIVYKHIVFFDCLDRLYAIDALNGKQVWSVEIESHSSNMVSAIDSNHNLIYLIVNCKLLSFDLNTGREQSVNEIENTQSHNIYPPYIYNDKVFVSARRKAGIDIIDVPNQKVMEFSIGYITTPLAISRGKIYAIVENKLFRSWELNDQSYIQKRIWTHQIEEGEFRDDVAPTIAEDVVYTLSAKYLHAFDASSGEELWKYRSGFCCPPVVKDKNLYCVSNIYSNDIIMPKRSGRIIALK